MTEKDKVTAINITLKVEDELVLLILLAADGFMNRMGNGENTKKCPFLIWDLGDSAPFHSVMGKVNELMVHPFQQWVANEIKGQRCQLTIAFDVPDMPAGVEFVYGSESMGPPLEIINIVTSAIQLTQPWYDKVIKARGDAERPAQE